MIRVNRWAFAMALLLAPMPALAFGTIHGLGQDAEHERITRKALAQSGIEARTLDELAGKRGTFGAVGAPDRPDRGLMSVSAAHCDNGDWLDTPGYPRTQPEAEAVLESCRAFIFVSMEEAVNRAAELVGPDLTINAAATAMPCDFNGQATGKCGVLEAAGMAFHASQDFYSHSNWVDPVAGGKGRAGPPGLGQATPAGWLDQAWPDERMPQGLISGCYAGFPETLYCQGRVRHATLNKDGARSPRGAGGVYRRAMDVAADDTKARWTWFLARLGEVYGPERGRRMACVIRRDDPARCGA
ncbi:MAG: hypothetical protein ACOYM5_15440 [Caulobacter sp.]